MHVESAGADVLPAEPTQPLSPSSSLPLDEGRLDAIRRAVASIIAAIGEDPEREGLRQTPARIAEMYAEVFSGITVDPVSELSVSFEEGHQEMVVLRDIGFHSMCEHHF